MTARPLSQTVEHARGWGRPPGDRPPRRRRPDRQGAGGAGSRVRELRPWAQARASTARSPTARPTCRSVCAAAAHPEHDDVRLRVGAAQHHVNCRLATRVLVPDAIPAERLRRYGARAQAGPLPGPQGGVLPVGLRARPRRARPGRRRPGGGPLRRAHRAVLRALPGRLREPAARPAARAHSTDERGADGRARAHGRAGRRDRARSACPAWSSRARPSTAAAWSRSPTCSSRRAGR